MRIEVLNGEFPIDQWHFVKDMPLIYYGDKPDTFESWRATVKETRRLQDETGDLHRAVTTDVGLRHIWCNGSSYWCGF